MIKAAPGSRDGSGVGQHTHAARHLGKVTSGNMGRRLIADTKLETGRTPVNELDCPLGLDDRDGSIDVFGNDITTVQESASH